MKELEQKSSGAATLSVPPETEEVEMPVVTIEELTVPTVQDFVVPALAE